MKQVNIIKISKVATKLDEKTCKIKYFENKSTWNANKDKMTKK